MTILFWRVAAGVVLFWWRRKQRPPVHNTPRHGKPGALGARNASARTAIQAVSAREAEAAPAEIGLDTAPPVLPAALQSFTLLRTEDLDDAQQLSLSKLIASMPEPHSMFLQITEGLDDIDDITEVVKNEPALAADVLRTVNSAAFSLTTPIASVHHAIAYLGVSYVKGLIAQSALSRTLPPSPPGSEQDAAMHRLWKASQIASAAAFVLARNLGLDNPAVASTQALLSNLGDINLVSLQPQLASLYAPDTSLLDRVRAQQQTLGVNAAIVAAVLAHRWGLPANIEAALAYSLLPLALPPSQHPLQGKALSASVVIYVAGRIGDAAVFNGMQDITAFDIGEQRQLELYGLPDYLQAAELQTLETVLKDSVTRRALNQALAAARA